MFGPRGTGKSTWLAHAYPDAIRVDLLQPESERELSARPERLKELIGEKKSSTVVIGEIQRVPELLPLVHSLIEKNPLIRFLLTGSSARKIHPLFNFPTVTNALIHGANLMIEK